ncbi:methyltransferase [Amycolatopsis jejuensis]|uniref:methyltransferase n=1 Tax=Amycolatopsis jejuensis TaxID=330084 RepID=UPI001FDF536B|nr:methyltransferase [Amycolatopsis jejuensis]
MSAITAALSWVASLRLGESPAWLAWCWACALGCGLTLTDLRCRRLPFLLVAALCGGDAVIFLAAALVDGNWSRLGFACIAALLVLTSAIAVQMLAPEHTGGGDSALYGALALLLGWFGWDGLLRGLLIAGGLTALVGVAVAVWSRRMKSSFPAGPSLLVGALASVLVT